MTITSHIPPVSFPCVPPNAGNGKREAGFGNGNGNKVETNGNGVLLLETSWKRSINLVETNRS